MSKVSKKTILLALLTIILAVASLFAVRAIAKADTVDINEAEISAKLTPVRETEYGKFTDFIVVGNTVYKNYEYGCVTATVGAGNSIMNARDYGGVNYNKSSGKMEFLKENGEYKLKSMILSRGTENGLDRVWNKLAEKFSSNIAYNTDYALEKIYEKYVKMCEAGYNCGIATDDLSIWDDSVIKLDFYDGDSKYGFDATNRVHVTTIAYSFLVDEAFAIHDEIFNFYKDAKAGSLSEPISDVFDYTENGVDGMVQAFALGYIFCPAGSGDLIVRAGTRWNFDKQEFEIIHLSYDELTKTQINDSSINDSPYYSGKGFYVEDQYDSNGKVTKKGIKTLFYEKYESLIASGFNPGIPDHEGIYYWDAELLKQAYVGSDGSGNAWGRTNMMLILNPYDGQVYAVYGEILNIVDKAAHGLGNARSLGYPMSDPKTMEVNGLTYTYQNFYRPYYTESTDSTIYTIEETKQLTRHVVGTTFEDLIAQNKTLKPNNPMYFYVVEPWLIALICIIPVVLAGAGVAFYFFVFKKKKCAVYESAEATAEPINTENVTETEGGEE